MKWMIASDLHGSAYYCRAMLEALEREQAQRLVLLGDLLYHGPRNPLPEEYDPKAVADMLNSISDQVLCVRGNCDSEVDQMMLTFPILADYVMLADGDCTLFATHGHNQGPDNLPMLPPGDSLLCGHIHVPVEQSLPGGVLYLNPGSVSLPKEHTPHSYMIWHDGLFSWHELMTGAFFEPLHKIK